MAKQCITLTVEDLINILGYAGIILPDVKESFPEIDMNDAFLIEDSVLVYDDDRTSARYGLAVCCAEYPEEGYLPLNDNLLTGEALARAVVNAQLESTADVPTALEALNDVKASLMAGAKGAFDNGYPDHGEAWQQASDRVEEHIEDLCSRFAPVELNKVLQVKFLSEHAKKPFRATRTAAGFDIHCLNDVEISPGFHVLVETGIAIAIPQGWGGLIWPRSGLAVKNGVDTMAGVIDSDYRGELKVALINLGTEPVFLNSGDRVAQLLIQEVYQGPVVVVKELPETVRSAGGFGSTGS